MRAQLLKRLENQSTTWLSDCTPDNPRKDSLLFTQGLTIALPLPPPVLTHRHFQTTICTFWPLSCNNAYKLRSYWSVPETPYVRKYIGNNCLVFVWTRILLNYLLFSENTLLTMLGERVCVWFRHSDRLSHPTSDFNPPPNAHPIIRVIRQTIMLWIFFLVSRVFLELSSSCIIPFR